MAASEECKKAGLKNVKELVEILPERTIYKFHNKKKKLFHCILIGAVIIKIFKDKTIDEVFEWLNKLKKDEENGK